MPNVGEFINAALIKAGVAPDNEFLKKILTNAELTKESVPDELVSQFNSNLMSLDQAKSNFDVKNHFYGSALAPVEKELMNLATSYELSEEDIAEINAIKSTFSKIPALKSKLDAAIAKKAAANGGDKGKHAEEIVRLNQEIAAAAKKENDRVMEITSQYENKLLDMSISNFLANYNFTEALPKDVAAMTAKNLFSQTTASKKAKVKLVNNELVLVNADDETLPYMESNQPVAFKDFADRIVADKKLLKTAPAAGNGGNGGNQGGGGQEDNKGLGALDQDFINRQREAFKSKGAI